MNTKESTFAVFEADSYFSELSYVKIVESVTSLNLKLASTDEAVIFNTAWPMKFVKSTYLLS